MIVKAIYTVSYLTESHPRPHRMTWKLITMREKHLDCKEQRSLTFAFDSCLVAKPNIRTPSVDCTGKKSRVGYRYVNTARFELKSCQFELSKHVFVLIRRKPGWAPYFAYLSLFPVSTLDVIFPIQNLWLSNCGKNSKLSGKWTAENRDASGTTSSLLEVYKIKCNLNTLCVHSFRVNFGLWSPNSQIIDQSLARIHVICLQQKLDESCNLPQQQRRYWWYLLSSIQANFNYLPKAIFKTELELNRTWPGGTNERANQRINERTT